MSVVFAIHALIQLLFIVRALLRPHRQPASRIAWIVVIAVLPVVGIIIYILFGEVNIGRRRAARLNDIQEKTLEICTLKGMPHFDANIPERYQHLFQTGRSISGFEPVGGNSAHLCEDSNVSIDNMVADIDAAKRHVHLLFYIWLQDNNGSKIIKALQCAARRGVHCRAMVDDLGSHNLIHSDFWKDMQNSGVQVAKALPIGNPLLRPFKGRIDLRNHRKIVVIDGRITYCGSQNCADPEFRVKPKFAPWVDIMMRFEGPIAAMNQQLFVDDWMAYVDEDISDLLNEPIQTAENGFVVAQVIGTGPTVRHSAMPEMFVSLMYVAHRELIITTPYYVPDESIQNALCASAYRGIDTTIIFPAKNDSWIVGAASRSYYADLLDAGVKIYEYEGGLLHAKSLTLDGEVALIGSANMDSRSFDLNYENNILYYDPKQVVELRKRQLEYVVHSRQISQDEVATWSVKRRLWNNTIAMLSPLL